jgi:hypothetical protein
MAALAADEATGAAVCSEGPWHPTNPARIITEKANAFIGNSTDAQFIRLFAECVPG